MITNIFHCWESMQQHPFLYIFYMLSFSFQIYFQRQETQKKTQKNKKKNTKKQQIVLRMKLRKDRFRMFGLIQSRFQLFQHYLRLILAIGRYDPIRPIRSHFANWQESKPSRREFVKKKKKKTQMQHRRVGSHVGGRTPRQAASNSGAAPSQPHQCFLSLKFWRSFIVFA